MTIQTFLETYPEFAGACVGAGLCLALVLNVLDGVLFNITDALTYRHRVARCEMRHSGQLGGWCDGRYCPSKSHCYYHRVVKRPPTLWERFKARLRDAAAKKK